MTRATSLATAIVLGLLTFALCRLASAQQFGGCFAAGRLCAGPSATVTVGEFNLATSKFRAGVLPGVGYGLTYNQDRWYATGAAAYVAFSVGRGEPNQAVPSVIFSFANYMRFGVGLSIAEQPDGPTLKQWRLLFGLGSDFGGSPKYLQQLNHRNGNAN